jgi:hypothetical protein
MSPFDSESWNARHSDRLEIARATRLKEKSEGSPTISSSAASASESAATLLSSRPSDESFFDELAALGGDLVSLS